MNTTHFCATAFAVTLVIAIIPAQAADYPKEGRYDLRTGCAGASSVLSGVKDNMGGTYTVTCVPDAPAGTLYNDIVAQCFGAWSLAGGNYEESGSCEMTDSAGDKFFGVYAKKGQDDGTWRVTGGTGKFEGMQSGGPWNLAIPKPMLPGLLGGVFHWWGSYKLR
jgi:hypothetical protein